MPAVFQIENTTARRVFLAAHGLANPPSTNSHKQSTALTVDTLGFVQVDSINTVARAHDHILWSRQSSYQPSTLRSLIEDDRSHFEHWTHDASILPIQVYPYWKQRFSRDAERLRGNWQRWFRDGYESQFDRVLTRIQAEGPVTSADVSGGEARSKSGWWDWHPSKTALEWLWRTGQLAITKRNGFHKVYDLAERVIPQQVFQQGAPDEALVASWACLSALRHVGFGSLGEIQGFWNALRPEEVKAWAKENLAAGRMVEVAVVQADGSIKKCLCLSSLLDAPPPEQSHQPLRIVSPFDPAFRDRKRSEGLFGFRYRIEVFVPEAKRQFGYYVFPILEKDQVIARIDVKAFRTERVLRVKALWPEQAHIWSKQRQADLEAELDRLTVLAGCDTTEFSRDWLRAPPRFG
jgi:uncharacterized protein YcaQ